MTWQYRNNRVYRTCMPRSRRGMSLVEAIISVLLVGGVMVAAMNAMGATGVSRAKIAERARALLLAQDLMSEILQQPYIDMAQPTTLGREVAERNVDRVDFDDVDDYKDWSKSPPRYRDGTPIADLDNWARCVKVIWLNPNDLNQVMASETGVKRIIVTVEHNDVEVCKLTAVRANTGAGP